MFRNKADSPINLPRDATSSNHAAVMFGFGLLFLVLIAVEIQCLQRPDVQPQQVTWLFWLLLALWMLVIFEALLGIWKSQIPWHQALQRGVLICLVPPFRMAISTHSSYESIWLPFWGWQRIDQQLFERMERSFAMPMLVIGLLIMPIIAAEYLLKERVVEIPYLISGLEIGKAVIWLAFSIEFVLMVSVAERKLHYCKKNWIDIIIILLPLLAFVRGLQLLQTTKITRVNKLIRLYRLRGLTNRAYRGLIVLEILERIFQRDPHKRLANLQLQMEQKQQEIVRLHLKIKRIEEKIHLCSDHPQ